jgi:hypothetical protein
VPIKETILLKKMAATVQNLRRLVRLTTPADGPGAALAS